MRTSLMIELCNVHKTIHLHLLKKLTRLLPHTQFCAHLSSTRVHSLWQLAGSLVDEEFWFQTQSGASSWREHRAVGLGKWNEAGGGQALRSPVGQAGGTRGSGRQVVDSVERSGANGTFWTFWTTIASLTHLIEIRVVQILKTWNTSEWNYHIVLTWHWEESVKTVD